MRDLKTIVVYNSPVEVKPETFSLEHVRSTPGVWIPVNSPSAKIITIRDDFGVSNLFVSQNGTVMIMEATWATNAKFIKSVESVTITFSNR